MKIHLCLKYCGVFSASLLLISSPLVRAQGTPAEPAANAQSEDETVELSAFEVRSTRDRGYSVTNSIGGSRVNMELMHEPTSVVVLPQQFLEDTGAAWVMDALQYVSGVNKSVAKDSGNGTIRGYEVNTMDFRDGLPDRSGASGQDVNDMSSIERVEIVKGAAGVLYGSHVLGGIFNLVTKKPMPIDQTSIKASLLPYSTYRVELDHNNVITADKKLRMRLISTYQEGETIYGGPNNLFTVNPVVSYHFSNRSKLWARFEYLRGEIDLATRPWVVDFPGNISTFLPVDQGLDNIVDSKRDIWRYKTEIGYNTSFEMLGADWDMRMVARLNKTDAGVVNHQKGRVWLVNSAGERFAHTGQAAGVFTNPDWVTLSIDRLLRDDFRNRDNADVNIDFSGKFEAGPTKNTLLLYMYGGWRHSDQFRTSSTFPAIDVYNRIQYPDPDAVSTFIQVLSDNEDDDKAFAWGVQNNMQMLDDRLTLVGGIRWDWGKTDSFNMRNGAFESDNNQDWSYKFGAIGEPVKGFGVFYNYATTFTPQGGLLNDGVTLVKNLEGVQNEVGLKFDLWDRRLTGTISVFDMELRNQIIQPPSLPDGTPAPQMQIGVAETNGWEFDLTAEPVSGLHLLLGYSDLTSETENGIRQRGVPQGPNYKMFGKYTLEKGSFKGLSFGAGYIYVNDRAGDTEDSFNLPPYDEVNAFIAYRRENWTMQVNCQNVLNEKFAVGSSGKTAVDTGGERTFRVTFTYLLQ